MSVRTSVCIRPAGTGPVEVTFDFGDLLGKNRTELSRTWHEDPDLLHRVWGH
jgi:hypothetical protein